jgi:predicted O-methyltransferase YrrM
VTAGGSSIPEVQALLRVLASGRRCAEAGTAYGEGAAAMAETAHSVVTVERDERRAAAARERLAPFANVELMAGDWREELPPHAPFDLVFLDSGGFKREPLEHGSIALDLLLPGGLLVVDDFTPGRSPDDDAARAFLFEHPHVVAAEMQVTAEMAVLIATRR